ncbi:hypothetical protein TYRP_003548 [Tyrophagus putrescentiae]|nr:hypothetical protein TYRP_003548 [Tyrophagus putrescentiae]
MAVGGSDNCGVTGLGDHRHHLGDSNGSGGSNDALLQSSSSGSPIDGDALLQARHPHLHHHLNQRSLSTSSSTSTSSSSAIPQGDDNSIPHPLQHPPPQLSSMLADDLHSLTPSLDANMMSQMMGQLPGGGNGQPMSPGSLHLHLQQEDASGEGGDDNLLFEEQLQSYITGGDSVFSHPYHHHHLQSSRTLSVDISNHHPHHHSHHNHHHHPLSLLHSQHQSLGYHDVPPNVELLGGGGVGGAVHHGHHGHHPLQHRSSMPSYAFLNGSLKEHPSSPPPSSSALCSSPVFAPSLIHPGLVANSTDPLMPVVASPRISSSSSSSSPSNCSTSAAPSPSTSSMLLGVNASCSTSCSAASPSSSVVADTSSCGVGG